MFKIMSFGGLTDLATITRHDTSLSGRFGFWSENMQDRPTEICSTFERANMVVEENLVCGKLANSMDCGFEKELPPLVFDDLVGVRRHEASGDGQPPPPVTLSTFERAYEVVKNNKANLECKKPESPALANSMDCGSESSDNDLVLAANVVSTCHGVRRGIPSLPSPSGPLTGTIPCLASPSVPVTSEANTGTEGEAVVTGTEGDRSALSSFQSSCRQKNRAEARLNSLYLGEETTAAKARCDSYSVRCCMFQLCSAETSPHGHMLAPEGVYTRTIRVDSCNIHACAPSQQDPTDSILKACNVSMCSPSSPINTMAERYYGNDTATTDICSLSMCTSALRISLCPTSCASTSPCTARCITVDICSPERLSSISPPNDAASARNGEWKHLSLNCFNVVLCSRPPKND